MSQSDNNSPKCPYHTAPSPAEGAQQQRELSTTPKQKHGDEPVTPMTTAFGAPVVDNQNSKTAGPRGPLLMEDVWLLLGDVQGSARQPYEVSIEVKRGPNGRVLE